MKKKIICELPKAELHLHLEGSLEPKMMFDLAKRNLLKLHYQDEQKLIDAYKFNSLQEFLTIYYQGMNVLQTRNDFYDLTYAYLKKAREDNVLYSEIFLDIQAHIGKKGIRLQDIFDGIRSAQVDAENQLGIKSGLIISFLRDLSVENALDVFEKIISFKSYFIGIGLSSTEFGNHPGKFKKLYDLARQEGIRLVAHAGEEAPADYIWEAIDVLGVERIDHGITAVEDNELMRRLAKDKIPLTLCPLSNIATGNIASLNQFPLIKMMEYDLLVTINSDDPAYFGGYINDNYYAIANALNLSDTDLKHLANNSLKAKFI